MNWREKRHCPHIEIQGIYGDEINHSGGYRLRCRACGRLLDGPVSLATDLSRIGKPEGNPRD